MFRKQTLAALVVAGILSGWLCAYAQDPSFSRQEALSTGYRNLCSRMVDLYYEAKQLQQYNSTNAIDWAGNPTPEFIVLDEDGRLQGQDFTPAQLSNTIGSIQEFVDLLEGGSVTQGNHLGNILLTSDPR